VHQIDGITMVGGVHCRDVWRAMLLHLAHEVFQPGKFSTDRRPVDAPVAS
jgi:hypothetical protein